MDPDHPNEQYCSDPSHDCHNNWQYHSGFTVNHDDVPWQQATPQDIVLAIEILGDHSYQPLYSQQ